MIAAALALAMTAPAAECVAPAGWNAIEPTAPRYILFGEMHGTEQAPAMFGDLACALAGKGERILVAVELGVGDNQALQRAWAGSHAAFETAVLDLPEWRRRDDGVSSRAMLAMLVRLHALKAQGRHIEIVAFNGVRDDAQGARWKALPGQGGHEAAQAENIRTAADSGTYDHVLVLVGGLHARKQPVTFDVTFEPMAMRLAPSAQILSLRIAHDGGTSWSCQPKEGVDLTKPVDPSMIACEPHAEQPDGGNGAPRIAMGSQKPGYDGRFYVGAITASPPARQEATP